ncbi:hypothetical protein ACEWY4_011477 [Coilia grayii]|uniref:SAM domain-containing protein n=1 Tax=Coilia grayii TaxID=363190 RepID=A0ABD1K4U5_9TELE
MEYGYYPGYVPLESVWSFLLISCPCWLGPGAARIDRGRQEAAGTSAFSAEPSHAITPSRHHKPSHAIRRLHTIMPSQAITRNKTPSHHHAICCCVARKARIPDVAPKMTQVNDELLQRITASKSQPPARNYRVDRRSGFPMVITQDSPPWEVKTWLNAKGFSKMTVSCLGILSGAQLFSLSKEELKAVCGDEGGRVYSQVTVQKTQLERFQGTTELEVIMRRRQEEVDAFTY